MESGEDTGASRRNSRLLMSSFSKRKVSRGAGLIYCYHHPCAICWLRVGVRKALATAFPWPTLASI